MGKTKNLKKVKKSKKKFSRKNVKMTGGSLKDFFNNPIIIIFLSVLLFGIYWRVQTQFLQKTFEFQKEHTPVLLELHKYLTILRSLCEIIESHFGENYVTTLLYGLHNYIIKQLPLPVQKLYNSMIKIPIIRPNALKLIHYLIENNFEKSIIRDAFLRISSGAEYYNEFWRLMLLDKSQINVITNIAENSFLDNLGAVTHIFNNKFGNKSNEFMNAIDFILSAIINKHFSYPERILFLEIGIDIHTKTSKLIELIQHEIETLHEDVQIKLKTGIIQTYQIIVLFIENDYIINKLIKEDLNNETLSILTSKFNISKK